MCCVVPWFWAAAAVCEYLRSDSEVRPASVVTGTLGTSLSDMATATAAATIYRQIRRARLATLRRMFVVEIATGAQTARTRI